MKHHRRPTLLGRPDLAPERLEQRRLLAAVDAIDFNIPEFTADNVASFDLYEDAAVVDGELRVAPDVRYGQGAFFTKDNLTLTPDKGFATSFSFDMGGVRGTSGGAGMAFVLFGRDTDPSLPAFPGGGLGYSGLWPSLAIEFDSAQSAGDPAGDHVAIHANGNATSPLAANTVVAVGGQLNDGQTRYAWVDYSGDTDVLRVYLNDVAQKPDQPTLSTTLDLSSLVGSAPRFGFTAASGYNFNHHDVSSWSFETVLPTTQPNQPPVAIDDNVLIEQNSGVNSIAVLPNDSDPDDDVLTITSAGPATNGTVTTNGQLVFYTPNLGYAGPDSFSYVVSDGRGGLSTATVDVTVQQIAAAGTFQLGSGTFEAVEDEGFVDVIVLRDGDTSTVATLDYLTSDGTATAGVDYQSRAGTLRFDPGQTSQTIRINISDDQLNEGDETFAISLDAVTGANLGAPRTAQITILDDDQPDGNGGLPWLEDFNLPNGTSSDTGTTAWSIDLNGSPASALQVNGNRLRLSDTDGPVEWRTDPIALGDADSASLSLRLSAAGSMETTGQFLDYVDVFYAADGGSPQLLERIVGNIGQRTLTYDGIVGNTVELIIRGVTTAGSEVYFIDDVLLEAAETPTFIPFSYYAQTEVPAETLGGDWQVVTGGSAGNHAVWSGSNFYNNPPAGDALAFDIVAETAGLYDVHLRAKAPSGDDDSVWVRITGTDVAQSNNISRTDGWVKFNNIARSSSFVWDRVHNVDAGSEPVSFFLPAGTHTLEIAAREDGTGIDGVYVTNTLDAPSTAQLDLADGIDEPVEPVGDFRRTEIVSDGLQNVTDVKWAGSLGDVLFVSERAGRIRIVEDGSLVNQAFVAFEDEVNGTRDRGLLGIELHPDFPTVPYVYALFTYDPPEAANGTGLAARDANGNRAGRVVRYTADAA
ncbi:MAG: Calx-beta domain-containing protein, partial [Planctomycetota bacterium]